MIQIKTTTPFIGFIDSQQGGRADNQDTCGYADTPWGFLIVLCDGMGGGPGGKVASSIAVDTIIKSVVNAEVNLSRSDIIQNAVKIANKALLHKIQEKPSLKGMGTTAAILLINENSAIIAYIGDSRIYQFRRGTKKYRTFDHSFVFELVKNGTLTEEQARLSDQSNIITRALGIKLDVEADIIELPYEKGDRFMLCTDGIWEALQEKELIKIAAKTASLSGTVESLMIRVNEYGFSRGGNHDNFSVALIGTTCNSILEEKMSTKTKQIILGLSIICCLSIIGNIFQLATTPKKVIPTNASSINVDSLINERIIKEREQVEMKFQKTIDTLTELINSKNVGSAQKLLKETNDKQGVIYKLDIIIKQLEELKMMSEGKEKGTKLNKTIVELNTILPDLKRYGIKDDDLKSRTSSNPGNVAVLLKYPIAKEAPTDKSVGHYNIIISILSSVRNKMSK